MKIALLTLSLFTASAVSVMVFAGNRVPGWSAEYLGRLRGTDAYYRVDQDQCSVGPLEVRLRGQETLGLYIGITFSFRHSLELGDAAPLLARSRSRLIDALHLRLSDLARGDIEDTAGRFRLKRDLRRLIENTVFPGKEARVERVWFDPLMIQGT